MDIKLQMKNELEKAQAIATKAADAGRELTDAEVDEANTHLKAYQGLKAQLEAAAGSEAVKAALAGINGGGSGTKAQPVQGSKAQLADKWAKGVGEALRHASQGADGAKALLSGTVGVSSIIGEPGVIPPRPLSILDLIRRRDFEATGNGNTFSYIQQLARPTGATPVADGAVKPTGVATFRQVDSKLVIVSLLSEPLPLRYVQGDFTGLIDLLKQQLGEAVLTTIEDQVINGNGVGENLTGILQTSGIQTKAPANPGIAGLDPRLQVSLAAANAVEHGGGTAPTAFALNPSDWESIVLARLAKNPQNEGAGESVHELHGLPVVTNLGIPAGTGLVGDWNTVELLGRRMDQLDLDTSGDLFAKNQFRARSESAVGVKIERANAFCRFTFTV